MVEKRAHLIIDDNGSVLNSSGNINASLHPASMTKMMTLYVAFEALRHGDINLQEKIDVGRGRVATIDDALKLAAIRSDNAAAAGIARHISGTEGRFAELMTQTARSLGMTNTYFANASGLPPTQSGSENKEWNKSTPLDMTKLARALYEHYPTAFQHYFARNSQDCEGRPIRGHNPVIGTSPCPGTVVIGGKTGFIRASGFNNIVVLRGRGGKAIFGVVFGADDPRSRDAFLQHALAQAAVSQNNNGGHTVTVPKRAGANRGIGDYISSRGGGRPGAAVSGPRSDIPGAVPAGRGWRHSFNAAVLKGIDDIEAGHATVKEIRVVQQVLVDNGVNLGKTGRHHDGVDGDARTLTMAGITQVKNRTPGPGT